MWIVLRILLGIHDRLGVSRASERRRVEHPQT